MKYNLVREEVAELFKLGKQLKQHDTMNVEIMHQNLELLTKPSPHLRPNQLKWWKDQLRFYDVEAPDWLLDASLEMMFNEYKDE